jgi:hypothetical protein
MDSIVPLGFGHSSAHINILHYLSKRLAFIFRFPCPNSSYLSNYFYILINTHFFFGFYVSNGSHLMLGFQRFVNLYVLFGFYNEYKLTFNLRYSYYYRLVCYPRVSTCFKLTSQISVPILARFTRFNYSPCANNSQIHYDIHSCKGLHILFGFQHDANSYIRSWYQYNFG